MLARLYALLAEVAWTARLPRHRAAVTGQLERLDRTTGRQDFDEVELSRLTDLSEQVRAAVAGRHRSPTSPVVS